MYGLFRRYLGWSSDEEHFIFDADGRCFIIDQSDEREPAKPKRGKPLPYTLPRAFAEVIQDLDNRPADEWEQGKILTFYGVTSLTAALAEEDRLRIEPDPWHSRRMWVQRAGSLKLSSQIVQLFDLVIARHWPDAAWRLSSCVKEYKFGRVSRLNQILSDLNMCQPQRFPSLIPCWLISHEKPNNYSESTLSDDAVEAASATAEKLAP